MFGEVLLRPELILQSLGKVPHLLSGGCLEHDLGGEEWGVGISHGGGGQGSSCAWCEDKLRF